MTLSLSPNKRLGQNFLHDKNILNKICQTAVLSDIVIEIGGGMGALTDILKSKVKELYVIEKDLRFKTILTEKVGALGKVFISDVLKFDFSLLPVEKSVIIGNLPYNISTLIIIYLLKTTRPVSMTFLVQKEVAERIVAKDNTKAYGRLSIIIQAISQVSLGSLVSKNVFYPKPKVTSQIIHIRNINYNHDIIQKLEILTAKLFSQSRKKVGKVFEHLNIPISEDMKNLRPENLSVEQYIEFAKYLNI